MLKACSKCGKIHEWGMCSVPRVYYSKKVTDASSFRSTSLWQRKRKQILERDNYICRLCWDRNRLTRDCLQVHHIIPINEDSSLRLNDDNLITLCSDCHSDIEKQKEKRSYLMELAKHPPSG